MKSITVLDVNELKCTGKVVEIDEQLVRFTLQHDHVNYFKKILIISNIILGTIATISFLLPYPFTIIGIMPVGCIISHTWMYWSMKRKSKSINKTS